MRRDVVAATVPRPDMTTVCVYPGTAVACSAAEAMATPVACSAAEAMATPLQRQTILHDMKVVLTLWTAKYILCILNLFPDGCVVANEALPHLAVVVAEAARRRGSCRSGGYKR